MTEEEKPKFYWVITINAHSVIYVLSDFVYVQLSVSEEAFGQ